MGLSLPGKEKLQLSRNTNSGQVAATPNDNGGLNAAVEAVYRIDRGDKEAAEQAACDAIYGVFDLVDIRVKW